MASMRALGKWRTEQLYVATKLHYQMAAFHHCAFPLLISGSLTTLLCEGELCLMFREDVLPYADRLLPVIIGHILDSSSGRKQEIAVKTLGNG